MIRVLIIFAFALFTNSVSAKMNVAESKKNYFHFDQTMIQAQTDILDDDSGEDDLEALKKVHIAANHDLLPGFVYLNYTQHDFKNHRAESPRAILTRICVLRI